MGYLVTFLKSTMDKMTQSDIDELVNMAFFTFDDLSPLVEFLQSHKATDCTPNVWDYYSASTIHEALSELPENIRVMQTQAFLELGADINEHKDSCFLLGEITSGLVLTEFDVKILKVQKWYRGVTTCLDDYSKGRDGYATFLTNNINQALSYAGADGYIAEIELPANVSMISHNPSRGHFNPVKFDDEARHLGNKTKAVVARDVTDNGFFSEFAATTTATNIAFLPKNDLLVKRVSPAIHLTHKSNLTTSSHKLKS